jgi:aminoglycoside 6'-N-acetyltransferase
MTIHKEDDAEIVIRSFVSSWSTLSAFFMGVFLKDTQQFVAQIYVGVVSWDLPEFEIGYFVDMEHEGKGYVTEATKGALRFVFEHLGAYRVRLECDDTNERSYRVAERCGMVQEGHIRENKINPDKSISGTLIYGLLRSEYRSIHDFDST